MTQRVRDRIINALIMTGSGAAVAILAFWLQTSDLEAQQLEEKINQKLDKKEYQEDQRNVWAAHDKMQAKEAETDKEFRDWMREQMSGLRQDIREIKK